MKTKSMLLVFLVVLLVFVGSCRQQVIVRTNQSANAQEPAPPQAAQPAQNTQQSSPSQAPIKQELLEGKIPEVSNCSIDYALGYKSGSCDVSADNINLTLKASKGEISGVAFYITGASGKSAVLKDSTDLQAGSWKTYVFLVSELREKVDGPVSEILVLPIKDVDGQESACKNQRLLVIKDEGCRI